MDNRDTDLLGTGSRVAEEAETNNRASQKALRVNFISF